MFRKSLNPLVRLSRLQSQRGFNNERVHPSALARPLGDHSIDQREPAPNERHRNLVGCGHLCCRLGLPGVLLEIGELQLELIQQRSALRGLSELLVPQLLDRQLELLDQQYPRLRLGFRHQPGRSLGTQHRLQRGHIVGERIIGAHRRPENHNTAALSELPIV